MSPHTADSLTVQLAIAVVKTLILVTGGTVTFFAYKAYRRTEDRSLGLLAAGFGLITLGLLLAGFLAEALGVDLAVGVLVESVLVLLGMVVIAVSLYQR